MAVTARKKKSYSAVAEAHKKRIQKLLPSDVCEIEGKRYDPWENAYPDEGLNLSFKTAYESDVYKAACVIVRALVPGHMRIATVIRDLLGQDYLNALPFITTVPKEPAYVYTYDNIKMEPQFYGDREILNNISFATHQEVLYPTYKVVMEARDDEKRKHAWEPKRVVRMLRRRTKLSITKLLAKYFDGKMTAAKIRDMGQTIEETLKPVELIYADTPERIVEMYTSGPSSCMTPASQHAGAWLPVYSKSKEPKLHPCLYYLHCPETVGVYYKSKGQVAARAILLKDKEGNIIGQVQPYGEGKAAKIISTELERVGGGKVLGKKVSAPWATFVIPGYWSEHAKDYVCPYPWFDMYADGHVLYIGFNLVDKNFVISPSAAKMEEIRREVKFFVYIKNSQRSQAGFFYAKRIVGGGVCVYCSGKISETNKVKVASDGSLFCCDAHMTAAGYVIAISGDGTTTIVKNGEAYKDACDYLTALPGGSTTEWYTNREALKRRGGLPYISKPGTPVDPESLSMSPYKYGYNGSTVCVDGQVHAMLQDNGYHAWRLRAGHIVPVHDAPNEPNEELLKRITW